MAHDCIIISIQDENTERTPVHLYFKSTQNMNENLQKTENFVGILLGL